MTMYSVDATAGLLITVYCQHLNPGLTELCSSLGGEFLV